MQPKVSNNLTKQDINEWIKQTIIFTTPIVLPVLLVVQSHWDWKIAWGAFYMALIQSLINLYGKYKQGV